MLTGTEKREEIMSDMMCEGNIYFSKRHIHRTTERRQVKNVRIHIHYVTLDLIPLWAIFHFVTEKEGVRVSETPLP